MSAPNKMRTALKFLCKHGEAALHPTKLSQSKWKKPLISKRVAADLRKQSIRDGTFGSFDTTTGIGWDPNWDGPPQSVGAIQLRPSKEHKRERNREKRAQKIGSKMEGMDDKIDKYYSDKLSKKPEKTFESTFKKMTRKS
mmetsp:Transcript_19012/g.27328  ORF Transcript_19012/g.27328 Transcript_19012/m.27328 type:complete len:140 (+) Transcript_19012:92-511(+)